MVVWLSCLRNVTFYSQPRQLKGFLLYFKSFFQGEVFRSLKGVDRNVSMGVEEYREALYNPQEITTRTYNKLEFQKKIGQICQISISKRALNPCFSKLCTTNLVECKTWD